MNTSGIVRLSQANAALRARLASYEKVIEHAAEVERTRYEPQSIGHIEAMDELRRALAALGDSKEQPAAQKEEKS